MQNYSDYLKSIGEYGIVNEVKHPIAIVSGIPHAKPNEIIIFETGQLGEVFSISEEQIEILIFSKEPVRTGIKLVRTDKFLSTPVGNELLGKVIDPLGNNLSENIRYKRPKEEREIYQEVQGIDTRARVKKPLTTGVTIVDMMVPLGKGQKELIIGDRKTGKSSFLLSVIKNQVNEGMIAIYTAIGKKKSDIKKMKEFFESEKILDSIITIATSSHDSPSLIFLTPYAAMTIAEYFRDQGRDVLIVFDDLSTHAKFYREISLVSKRFPGRDSYPGNIFYIHAKLMERAGNFRMKDNTENSISCLPVVETIEGDLTGYIATNVMGMTDGHIFFDSNAYFKGRRPTVNVYLSVSRVGKQTQSSLKKEINHEVMAFLSDYERLQNYSHFGAELSGKTKGILKTGERIYKFFDQHFNLIIPEEIQILLFALIWTNFFDAELENIMNDLKIKLTEAWKKDEAAKKIINSIINVDTFYNLLTNVSNKKEEIYSLVKKIGITVS